MTRDRQGAAADSDLFERRPGWALATLTRLSLRRAVVLLKDRQVRRRAAALSVARAIHTSQDQTKAMRCFSILSAGALLMAMGYGALEELILSAMWVCTTGLLVLNVEKAWARRLAAIETVARLNSRFA